MQITLVGTKHASSEFMLEIGLIIHSVNNSIANLQRESTAVIQRMKGIAGVSSVLPRGDDECL